MTAQAITGPADLRPKATIIGSPLILDQPLLRTPTVRRYPTFDARTGKPGAEHVREDRPDGSKRFRWEPTGAKPADLWYGCPADYPADAELVICEGEKATEAVREAGYPAIGHVAGASTLPSDAALALLQHRPVVLWPDNDEPGQSLMHKFATRLEELGHESVRYVQVPEAMPEHGDAADLDDAAIHGLIATARRLPILSRAGPVPSAGKNVLRFRTAREVMAEVPEATEWSAYSWVAFGCLHELVGKAKAAGKTTFLMAYVRACLDGSGSPRDGRGRHDRQATGRPRRDRNQRQIDHRPRSPGQSSKRPIYRPNRDRNPRKTIRLRHPDIHSRAFRKSAREKEYFGPPTGLRVCPARLAVMTYLLPDSCQLCGHEDRGVRRSLWYDPDAKQYVVIPRCDDRASCARRQAAEAKALPA